MVVSRSMAVATLVVGSSLAAAFPWATRWGAQWATAQRVARASRAAYADGEDDDVTCIDPLLSLRVERLAPLLASWQTVGGCGAGSGSAGTGGVKWIGRNVTGGLFNVQCQASYSPQLEAPKQHDFALTTVISKDLSDTWNVGVGVPLLYKYLVDPYNLNLDISNSGFGDVSLQVTRKLGPINATSLTASLGLPTGTHDVAYKMHYLRQNQQLGIGRVTGSLTLDHTMDQMWGLIVVGAVASWRGGENELGNYRAPSATGYGYAGWFVGPFVPAVGLSLTGFTGHDRDQTEDEYSPLFSFGPSLSLEWSSDVVALLVGGSLPYQYDGIDKDTEGRPRSMWGFGQWVVALGVSVAPF